MGESSFNAKQARAKRPCPLWVDAFQRDTQHLEADEVGAYLLILMAMWTRESCDFPDDDVRLARVARVSVRLWKSRIGPVIRGFLKVENGTLISKRLREEAAYVERHCKAQSDRKTGENLGKPLKGNERGLSADITAEPTAEASPDQPTQQPNNPREASANAAASRPQPPRGGEDHSESWTDERLWQEVVAAVGLQNQPLPTHWQPPAAIIHVGRWRSDLGLSALRIVDAALQSRGQHKDPPKGPKALDGVMQRLADQLSASGSPSTPETTGDAKARWDRLTAGYGDQPAAAAASRR